MTDIEACRKVIENARKRAIRSIRSIQAEIASNWDDNYNKELKRALHDEFVKKYALESVLDEFEFTADCVYNGIDPFSGEKVSDPFSGEKVSDDQNAD